MDADHVFVWYLQPQPIERGLFPAGNDPQIMHSAAGDIDLHQPETMWLHHEASIPPSGTKSPVLILAMLGSICPPPSAFLLSIHSAALRFNCRHSLICIELNGMVLRICGRTVLGRMDSCQGRKWRLSSLDPLLPYWHENVDY